MIAEVLAVIEAESLKGMALSLLGGFGSYLHGVREGRISRGLLNFSTELTLALVIGLIFIYLGQWQNWPIQVVYVLVLIFSNNSSESLGWLKDTTKKLLEKIKSKWL